MFYINAAFVYDFPNHFFKFTLTHSSLLKLGYILQKKETYIVGLEDVCVTSINTFFLPLGRPGT